MPRKKNCGDVIKPVLRHQMDRCQTTTMLTKASLLNEIFPLEKYPAATDIVLQIELCTRTKFGFIEEPLVYRPLNNDGVGSSLINRETRIQIVYDYKSIYNKYPKIKNETLAKSYSMLGQKIAEESLWSLRTVLSIGYANYYSPHINPNYVLLFLSSFFGHPGISIYKQARPFMGNIKKHYEKEFK
jgi:hypothetical protein